MGAQIGRRLAEQQGIPYNDIDEWTSVHLRDGDYQGAMKKILANQIGTSDTMRTNIWVGLYFLDKHLLEKLPGSRMEYTDVSADTAGHGELTVTARLRMDGKLHTVELKIEDNGAGTLGANTLGIKVGDEIMPSRSEVR
jgi:hypothetical protein